MNFVGCVKWQSVICRTNDLVSTWTARAVQPSIEKATVRCAVCLDLESVTAMRNS